MSLIAALSVTFQSTFVKERVSDHIYYKLGGAAFTYDVFKPKKPNGVCLVWVVSGGWFSDHKDINPALAEQGCEKGVTVIQVVHGTQPRFKMESILESIHRAVGDVRLNASKWGINPKKIGISGASAGGHLSLMVATQGVAVKGVDSTVQSAAVFFPPTDFLNWGSAGVASFKNPLLRQSFGGAFSIDPKTPDEKLVDISKLYSPISYASANTPSTLLIHGDKDLLVPIQQSQLFKAKLDEVGVPCTLTTVPDVGHGWKGMNVQMDQVIDWHLKVLK
jgi:acetyl esterase/lipase